MTKESIYEMDKKLQLDEKAAKKNLNTISNLRLALAIIIIVSTALYFKDDNTLGGGIALLGLFLFLVQLRRFHFFQNYIDDIKRQMAVVERYQERLNDRWQYFADDGSDFMNEDEAMAVDLDLFGPGSLFQYLSVAHTNHGRKSLAKLLTKPGLHRIKERQEAVAELLKNDEEAILFESLGYEPNERKRAQERRAEDFLRQFAQTAPDANLQWYRFAAITWPLLTLFTAMLAYLQIVSWKLPLICVIAQIGATILLNNIIRSKKELAVAFVERLRGLNGRLMLLLKNDYESAYLEAMKKELMDSPIGFLRLSRIVSTWKWRDNFIMYWILCGIFAWDFRSLSALEAWKKVYGPRFSVWLDWIGEVEALYSLGSIGRTRETEATFPEVLEGEAPYIAMTEGRHPLINPDEVVANDYAQHAGTSIITGSNMSGKSTFMRTLGLNAVLAYAGGMVSCKSFQITPMRVMTSMRVKDDVRGGISTFYGEILRIKSMSEFAKEKEPMLVLIDEIFKGTNSADRIIGAKAAIHKLNQPWIVGMVTTHDFELCDLVEDENIVGNNYHFEEYYVDNEIYFEYKIKPGRCRTTNAQHLMRMAGLLDEEM